MSFIPVKNIPPIRTLPQGAVSVTRGDALTIDSSGHLTNASITTVATIDGVAAETYNNSAGVAGAVNLKFFPTLPDVTFKATCASTTPAETDVGETVDLAAAGTVNVGSTSTAVFLVTAWDSADTSYVLGTFANTKYLKGS